MLATYKATLHGNSIRWTDERSLPIASDQDVEVLITVLSNIETVSSLPKTRGERMARCLEKIAKTGGISGIADPVLWQRELRQDRQLIRDDYHDVNR